MAIDRRIKGCSNINCTEHIKKTKYKPDDLYCKKCGAKLVFVCAKCFCEIEDVGTAHRLCSRCEAEAAERKEQIAEKIEDVAQAAGKAVAGAAVAVFTGIAGKVLKDGKVFAIKRGTALVENVFKRVIK